MFEALLTEALIGKGKFEEIETIVMKEGAPGTLLATTYEGEEFEITIRKEGRIARSDSTNNGRQESMKGAPK